VPPSPPLASHAAVIAAFASASGCAAASGASKTVVDTASKPMITRCITVRRRLFCPLIQPPAVGENSMKSIAPFNSLSDHGK
jgi:hypothetical protein